MTTTITAPFPTTVERLASFASGDDRGVRSIYVAFRRAARAQELAAVLAALDEPLDVLVDAYVTSSDFRARVAAAAGTDVISPETFAAALALMGAE